MLSSRLSRIHTSSTNSLAKTKTIDHRTPSRRASNQRGGAPHQARAAGGEKGLDVSPSKGPAPRPAKAVPGVVIIFPGGLAGCGSLLGETHRHSPPSAWLARSHARPRAILGSD